MPINIGDTPPNVYTGDPFIPNLPDGSDGLPIVVPSPGQPAPIVPTIQTTASGNAAVFITNPQLSFVLQHMDIAIWMFEGFDPLSGKPLFRAATLFELAKIYAMQQGLEGVNLPTVLLLALQDGSIVLSSGEPPDTVPAHTTIPGGEPAPVPTPPSPPPGEEPLPPPPTEEPPVVTEPTPTPTPAPAPAPVPTGALAVELRGIKEAITKLAGEVLENKQCCERTADILSAIAPLPVSPPGGEDFDQTTFLQLTNETALPVIAQLISDGNTLLAQENDLLREQLLILEELIKMGTVFSAIPEFPGWKPTGQKQNLIFSGGFLGGATTRFISDKIPWAFVLREATFWAGNDGLEWFAYMYGYADTNDPTDGFGAEIKMLFTDPTIVKDVLLGIGLNITLRPNILVPLENQYIHWETTNNDLTFQIAGTSFVLERMEAA